MPSIRYLEAVRLAQLEEMRRDPDVFVIGEDIRSSQFGTTTGFVEEFGPSRVVDVPISELGFTGIAAGAAMTGLRPIVDMTYSTFLYLAMDQLVNQVAKNRYMFGGQARVPVVYRTGMLYKASTAAHHSDRPYAMFLTVPGLKVIVPSSPREVRGLLKSAVRSDDPVICFEDSTLWARRGDVPDEEETIPLGRGRVVRAGADATVVAIGGLVPEALRAAAALEEEDGIDLEVLDPRSLVPLDLDLIEASVRRTGRLVVAEPGNLRCGAGAEIAARVVEDCWDALRGPVLRVATPDVHVPFSPALEERLYPGADDIVAKVRRLAGVDAG